LFWCKARNKKGQKRVFFSAVRNDRVNSMLRWAGKFGSMLGHSLRGRRMRKQFAVLAVGCLTLGLMAVLGSAQMDKASRPSPAAKASCALADGKTITVDYSSPRAKGRKIFGGLVPYGEVWRAGANEATTFVNSADLMVGGTHVPVVRDPLGRTRGYTIFAIPNEDKWTLIISKKTGEWGIPYPGADSDLARVDMKASTLPAAVENFTIAFDKAGSGCKLRMDWETTRASVDISKM
jgi:DUF2911 family protein